MHKNQQKNTFGTRSFSEKSILDGFLDSLWVPGELQKGRLTLTKTTPWRDMVPFCRFECITFAAGSILALFGHYFDTVLAHKKLLTGCACTLSVSGPAECAKRFESVAPLRDVLDGWQYSRINSCINLYCMILRMQKDRMQSCAEGLANPGGF